MPARVDTPPRSAAFERALAELTQATWRPEIVVAEMPPPQRIAPFAAAITADLTVQDAEVGTGRLILLHDPDGNSAWEGTFRLVSYCRAEVDPEMVTDPLLADVGWSWLMDALESHGAEFVAPSGTVTAVSSSTFGGIEVDATQAEVEIRASWTPVLDDGRSLTPHLAAWSDELCSCAGVPPLPAGVVMMSPRRAGRGSRRE